LSVTSCKQDVNGLVMLSELETCCLLDTD